MIKTLNKSAKQTIRHKLLCHAFADRAMELALRRQELAYHAYSSYIDIDSVSHLSAPWVTRSQTRFSLACENDVIGFDISGHSLVKNAQDFRSTVGGGYGRQGWWNDTPEMERKIILPCGNSTTTVTFNVKSLDLVKDRHTKMMDGDMEFHNEVMRRSREIAALLAQTTSVKKLLEAWPEVEPFIPEGDTASPANLPAPTDLNKSLGLPV